MTNKSGIDVREDEIQQGVWIQGRALVGCLEAPGFEHLESFLQ